MIQTDIDCPFSPPVAEGAVELALIRDPSAVRFARRLVREWFRHWRLPEEVIEAGELVSSELVTNAITKTNTHIVRFRTRWHGSSGYIEVWDADPNPPVERTAGSCDTGGRGLFLVGKYAQRWNYYPAEGGKVVWAELGLPSAVPITRR